MINFNHLSYNFLLVDVHAELGARLLSGEEVVLEDPPHGFVSPDHGAAHQEVGAGQPPHVLHTLTVSPTDNWCSWSNTILNILNICPHSYSCCCERKVVFCIPYECQSGGQLRAAAVVVVVVVATRPPHHFWAPLLTDTLNLLHTSDTQLPPGAAPVNIPTLIVIISTYSVFKSLGGKNNF